MPRSGRAGDIVFYTAITFIILFLSSTITADFAVNYTYSVASAKHVPGGFQFLTCEGIMPSTYVFSGCIGLINDTCINGVSPDVESLNNTLTLEEAGYFKDAINGLNRSALYVFNAAFKRNGLIYAYLEDINRKSCGITDLLMSNIDTYLGTSIDNLIGNPDDINNVPFSFILTRSLLPNEVSNCILSRNVGSVIDGNEIVYSVRSSLEAASIGLNSAMDVLQNETDNLYFEGGGYDDHSLPAVVTYDKIRNFINESNSKVQAGGSYSDFGLKWASFCGDVQWLKDWYVSSGVTECRAARILNTALSKNSIFLQIVGLYREAKNARGQLKEDVITANDSANVSFGYAAAARKRMQENGYSLVDIKTISAFRGAIQSNGSDIIPSDSFLLVDRHVNSTGTSPGANTLIAEAQNAVKLQERFYYSIAIQKLREANRLSLEAIKIANSTDQFVGALLADAERITAAKRATADSAIKSFAAQQGTEVIQRQLAMSRFNEAESEYQRSENRTGVRLRVLMNASAKFDEAADLISAKGIIIAMSINSLNESIQNLKKAISLSKTDVVPTVDAEDLLNRKQVLIGAANIAADTADSARAEIDAMTATLYTRALQQYSGLAAERKTVLQTIDIIGAVNTDVSQQRAQVNSFESLVYTNGSFIPERALGSYSRIKSTYDDVINVLMRNVDVAMKDYLPRKSKVIKTYQTVPIVDASGTVTTSIDIINDLPINVSKPLTIHFDSIPLSVNSNISMSAPGISVVSSGNNGVDVYLPGIAQMSMYNVRIVTPFKVATTVKEETNRVSLTPYQLVESTTYTINVQDDLDTLSLSDSSGADDCKAYLNGRQQTLLFPGAAFTARLSPVPKGQQKVTVTCTTFNPMEITESNSTGVGNDIDYLFNIRSTKSDLENVTVSITLKPNPSLVVSDSIRVADTSGAAPSDFSYSISDGRYVAKWTIPILSRSFQTYRVFYKTTDIDAYYNDLLSQVLNASEAEHIDVSSSVSDANYRAQRGDYADATEELRRAQRLIDKGRNERLQREAVSNRLSDVSATLSSIKNMSAEVLDTASFLSMPDTVFELNKQLAEFESRQSEADLLLSMNDTTGALSVVKDLEKMAKSNSLDNTITAKQESLFKLLSKQKSTAFDLSSFGDTKSVIAAIEASENLLKSASVDIVSNRYSSAMRTLSNVSSQITGVGGLLSNMTDSATMGAAMMLSSAKSVLSRWKSDKDGISGALSIGQSNPGKRVDTNSTDSKIADSDQISSALSVLYSKLSKYGKSDIISNMPEFRDLGAKTDELTQNLDYLAKQKDDYKSQALESLNDTSAILDNKMGNASTKEERDMLTSLQPTLMAAKDSYDSGMYLDSMILADYARTRASGFTPTPQPLIDPLLIYVAIVVVASAAVVVLLFRKEEPKGPRIIERFKLD